MLYLKKTHDIIFIYFGQNGYLIENVLFKKLISEDYKLVYNFKIKIALLKVCA